MKIIDVAEFYAEQGGGVRTYVNQKLQAAADAGHEAIVIAPGPETKTEYRFGGRVEWIASRPMPLDPRYFLLLNERAVHQILNREKAEVIEGSSPWTGGWMVARYAGSGVKSFIFHQDPVAVYPQTLLGRHLGYERTDNLFSFYFSYLRRLSKHYHLTVTSGQWLAERLRSRGIEGATAVPFGVDKQVFTSAQPSAAVKAHLLAQCAAPEDADLLITVSRHHPEKRLLSLIEAFANASRRRPLGLVIYGDGPMRPLIERKANKTLGVFVAGYAKNRPTLAQAMASADAMLHGSGAETFGIVLAEALCTGLPLIAPNRGGAPELTAPSYAELFDPGNVEQSTNAIHRLLDRNRDQLKSAAKHAGHTNILDTEQHFKALFETYRRHVEAARSSNRR